jgi:hypothetical protein
MKCNYCGKNDLDQSAKTCPHCGGDAGRVSETKNGIPFYWNGFMVWPEIDVRGIFDCYIYHIWAGSQYVCGIRITKEMARAWDEKTGGGIDHMDLVEKLMRLAIGDSEVERYKDKYEPRWITFEIRRVEDDAYTEAKRIVDEFTHTIMR